MKIGIAQTNPIKGDISGNITKHLRFIEKAISLNTDAIFFPELSLTGYEAELAKTLATDKNDNRLAVFRKMSDANNITIGISLPTKADNGINISIVVFQPNIEPQTYSKMQLHSDEFPYFVSGDKHLIVEVENKKIALAICYESLQPSHVNTAIDLGAEIYLASVANSKNGIKEAFEYYPDMAKKNNLPILMANFIGNDSFQCFGNSAVFSKNGLILAQLNENQEGIIVFDTETEATEIRFV
jgi:predicted amidohydrolase